MGCGIVARCACYSFAMWGHRPCAGAHALPCCKTLPSKQKWLKQIFIDLLGRFICTQGITGTPVIDPRGNGTIYVGAVTTADNGTTIKCVARSNKKVTCAGLSNAAVLMHRTHWHPGNSAAGKWCMRFTWLMARPCRDGQSMSRQVGPPPAESHATHAATLISLNDTSSCDCSSGWADVPERQSEPAWSPDTAQRHRLRAVRRSALLLQAVRASSMFVIHRPQKQSQTSCRAGWRLCHILGLGSGHQHHHADRQGIPDSSCKRR